MSVSPIRTPPLFSTPVIPSEITQWKDWVDPILDFANRICSSNPFLFPHSTGTITLLLKIAQERKESLSLLPQLPAVSALTDLNTSTY